MAETFKEDQNEREEQRISTKNDVAVSVSFGRFENDLLSWERWSSFSQNKYLEEVEKCSTPGSVASKKAYFEAHYKKIASRKAAELLEQEQQLEADSLRANYSSNGTPTQNDSNFEFDLSHLNQTQNDSFFKFNFGHRDQTQNCSNLEFKLAHLDEPNQDAVGVDCGDALSRGNKDSQEDNLSSEKSVVAVLVQEENPLKGSLIQCEEVSVLIKEENHSNGSTAEVLVKEEEEIFIGSQERFEEENYSSSSQPQTNTDHVEKVENTKLKSGKESRKVVQRSPASKEKNPAKMTKKQVNPNTKPAQTSAPRASKLSSASPVISTSRVSTRKESSTSRKKNLSTTENKLSTSTSIHISLNAPPINSNSSFLDMTRRPFIMEKMRDKEIVKRVFKEFQNTYDTSKSKGKGLSSTPQKVSKKGSDRISSSMTQVKEKEGTRTTLAKVSPQGKRMDTRHNPLSASQVKAAGVKQTNTKADQTSPLGFRSSERAEKQREVLKNVDEKSKVKSLEKTRLRPKSKDGTNDGINRRAMSWR